MVRLPTLERWFGVDATLSLRALQWGIETTHAPVTRKNQDVNNLCWSSWCATDAYLNDIYIVSSSYLIFDLTSAIPRFRFISCSTIADKKGSPASQWRQVGHPQSNENANKSISNFAQDQTPCKYLLKLGRGIFIYDLSVLSKGITTL